MMHLIKVIFLFFLTTTPSVSGVYEGGDDIFLKPEYLFPYHPIEIKQDGIKATLLFVRQKDGVGFYLINKNRVNYIFGVRFIDKIENAFIYNNMVIFIVSTKELYSGKGTAYSINALDIVADKENGEIMLFDGPGPEEWKYCFDGVYSDGRVSKCFLKDADSVKKFLDDMYNLK